MKKYVALLRGVTPVGKNKVPMAQLREVLHSSFKNVETYIQTGNILLESDLPPGEIELKIHTHIKEQIGPELSVVVRLPEQLQQILEENPFTDDQHDASRIFFVLFATMPSSEKVTLVMDQEYKDEQLIIIGQTAYLYIPGAYGRGKLSSNYLERKLGVAATMRNMNTMRELVKRSHQPQSNHS